MKDPPPGSCACPQDFTFSGSSVSPTPRRFGLNQEGGVGSCVRYSKFAQGPQRQVLAGSGGVHGHLRIWEAGQRANIYSKLKTLSQNKKEKRKMKHYHSASQQYINSGSRKRGGQQRFLEPWPLPETPFSPHSTFIHIQNPWK